MLEAVEALPSPWPEWPGGRPDAIEAALLDAVFDIRARYGGAKTGVRAVIHRWHDHRSAPLDDLQALAAVPPDQLAQILKNDQKVNGRRKALLVLEAAQALLNAGVRTSQDALANPAQAMAAYTSVRGLGQVTATYMLMLLGVPGVKADTWITRFVSRAVGRAVTAAEAEGLLHQVASVPGSNPTDMDYAIWAHLRRPQRR